MSVSLRPIDSYLSLRFDEVEREIKYLEAFIGRDPAMSQDAHDILELRLVVLRMLHKLMFDSGDRRAPYSEARYRPVQILTPEPGDAWIEDFNYEPADVTGMPHNLFAKAFRIVLPYGESGGRFPELIYRRDSRWAKRMLLFRSLELTMTDGDFDAKFLDIPGGGPKTLEALRAFVPAYRAYLNAQSTSPG